MLANFLRNTWRLSRKLCRSEIAVILLVLLSIWYVTKWLYPKSFTTNFEASNSYLTDVKLAVNEHGGKEIGFRHLQSKDGVSWKMRYKNFALYAVQGRRASMEDRFNLLFDSKESVQMFGIYDGHGGTYVANEAEQYLLNNCMARFLTANPLNVPEILKEETLLLDKKIMQLQDRKLNLTGSTALFGVLENNRLHIANLGDCRAIAVKKSDDQIIQITTDHKPINEKEAEMVKKAGGSVIWNGVWRVAGILAVSRALGDGFLKLPGWISATPDVITMDVGREPLKFVLLASDGLWDVITNEEAATFVQRHLYDDELFGAKQLVDTALRRGSMDNITVMIIILE